MKGNNTILILYIRNADRIMSAIVKLNLCRVGSLTKTAPNADIRRWFTCEDIGFSRQRLSCWQTGLL